MIPDLRLRLYPGNPSPWRVGSSYVPSGSTEITASGGTIANWAHTDELDIRVDMALNTWTPPTNDQSILFRYLSGTSGTLGHWFRLQTDGKLNVVRNGVSLSSSGFRTVGGEDGERLTVRCYMRVATVFGVSRLVLSFYVGRDGLQSQRWESLGTRYFSVSSFTTTGQMKLGITDLAPGLTDGKVYGWMVLRNGSSTFGVGDTTGAPIDPGLTSFSDGFSSGTTWATASSASALDADVVELSTTRIQSMTWALGTPDPLAGPSSNQAKITISDPDREWDPDNTSGPYYGLLQPRTPVTIWNETSGFPEWYGHVESFVPTWRGPGDGSMTFVCGDLLSLAADTPIRRDEVADRTVELRPDVYLSFDQLLPDGTIINEGVSDFPSASAPNLRTEQTCVRYSNVGGAAAMNGSFPAYIGTAPTSVPPMTLMFWTTASVTGDLQVVFRDYQVSPALNRIGVYFDADGRLTVDDNNGAIGYKTSNVVIDGTSHFFVVRFNDTGAFQVRRDGAGETLTAVVGGSFTAHTNDWYFGANADSAYGMAGAIDELVIATYTVDDADSDAIYAAAVTARTIDETLINMCLSAGAPSNSVAVLGTATGSDLRGGGYGGSSLLAGISAITSHEGGHATANQYGSIDLYPSDYRTTVTPSVLITDEDRALISGEYRAESFVTYPSSVDSIVNTVEVVWSGVSTVFTDPGSVSRYGSRRRQIRTSGTTYAAAKAAADSVLTRYASPRSWVTSVQVNLGVLDDPQDFLSSVYPEGSVRIRRQPLGTGSVSTSDYWVDQIRYSVAGVEMTAELILTPM